MRRILDVVALTCCGIAICLAYDPTFGVWDKGYLMLLVPSIFVAFWSAFSGD